MSENQTPDLTDDLDLDAWINGGAKKAHYVTLYARADLLADIEELEQKRRVALQAAPAEATLGGGGSTTPELDDRINQLYYQLDSSRREFRVTGMSETELDAIRAEVRRDFKAELDQIAAAARAEGQDVVRRLGTLSAQEVNNLLRGKALEASNKFVEAETSIRALARTTTTKRGVEWVSIREDQFRRMLDVIGAQVELLNRAFSRAANEAPVVTVPKSPQP